MLRHLEKRWGGADVIAVNMTYSLACHLVSMLARGNVKPECHTTEDKSGIEPFSPGGLPCSLANSVTIEGVRRGGGGPRQARNCCRDAI